MQLTCFNLPLAGGGHSCADSSIVEYPGRTGRPGSYMEYAGSRTAPAFCGLSTGAQILIDGRDTDGLIGSCAARLAWEFDVAGGGGGGGSYDL